MNYARFWTEVRNWCPGRDLNPHSACAKKDFKSFASADFATRAYPAAALKERKLPFHIVTPVPGIGCRRPLWPDTNIYTNVNLLLADFQSSSTNHGDAA